MKFKLKVHIKKIDTGEVAIYHDNFQHDGIDYDPCFIWLEGNYSCDCNLHVFFNDAKGISCESIKCSDDKYSILKIIRTDNDEVLYDHNMDCV